MFFWIALVVITVTALLWGGYEYTHAPSYNRAGDVGFALFITLFIGGMISFLVLVVGASTSAQDRKFDVPTGEKTYTLAENSVPEFEDGELEFAYVENGQIKTFEEYVRPFEVSMEKPKALKIIEVDTVNKGLAPWVLDNGLKVEIIK